MHINYLTMMQATHWTRLNLLLVGECQEVRVLKLCVRKSRQRSRQSVR